LRISLDQTAESWRARAARFATEELIPWEVEAELNEGRLPPVRSIIREGWMMLLIALAGLVGNFVLYVVALTYASPTINQVVADPQCDLDYIPNVGRTVQAEAALCNCLGFGSKNSAIVIGRAHP